MRACVRACARACVCACNITLLWTDKIKHCDWKTKQTKNPINFKNENSIRCFSPMKLALHCDSNCDLLPFVTQAPVGQRSFCPDVVLSANRTDKQAIFCCGCCSFKQTFFWTFCVLWSNLQSAYNSEEKYTFAGFGVVKKQTASTDKEYADKYTFSSFLWCTGFNG